jgi:hypothetical protein
MQIKTNRGLQLLLATMLLRLCVFSRFQGVIHLIVGMKALDFMMLLKIRDLLLSDSAFEHGFRENPAIYGGVKQDKAIPEAEGSPCLCRGIPGRKAGVTQSIAEDLHQTLS